MNNDDKKCSVVDIPNLQRGWGCCSCRTFNGDQRDKCKVCEHPRCDNPSTKTIPFKEDGGVRLITVDMKSERGKGNLN